MAYTAAKPPPPSTIDELRARIPGWGADLDPLDRPSVPQLRFDVSGAHWDFPDRQPEHAPRERSIEHGQLTPVFGTTCPTHGLSGVMRRFSYRRFSEAKAAHWLILLAADRVDAAGSHVSAALRLRPDPIASGLRSELSAHGLRSRLRRGRTDLRHQWLDPVVVLVPWAAMATIGVKVLRTVRRRST